MKELGGLVLVFASTLSYVFVSTKLGLYQRWPVVHLLLAVAGCALLVWALPKRKVWWSRTLAGLALLAGVGVTGLFTWWTLAFSTYADDDTSTPVGTELAAQLDGLRFSSHDGETAVSAGQATLVVFYRGFW